MLTGFRYVEKFCENFAVLGPRTAFRAARFALDYIEDEGYLRLAVPDALRQYADDDKDLRDGHRVQYSSRSLRKLVRAVGFHRAALLEAADVRRPWIADVEAHEVLPSREHWGRIKRTARSDVRGAVSIVVDAIKNSALNV